MPRNLRFWRNAALVAGAHLVVVIGILRGSKASVARSSEKVVWMTAPVAEPQMDASESEEETPSAPAATPDETPEAQPVSTPTSSDIDLSTPAVNPTPTSLPRTTPEPTAKRIPKKPVAKPTPSPKKKAGEKPKTAAPAKKPKPASAIALHGAPSKTATSRSANTSSVGNVGAAGTNPDAGWYGTMLQDRFTGEWVQPTSVKAAGEILTASVHVRIEKDGRVSRFEITKPSGNMLVDESVSAVASKVTRVDPLPKGIGDEHYDVTITFKWNPNKEGAE